MAIKVGFHGMDDRSIQRLLTVFKMVFKGQCIGVDIADANTVIVDLDHDDHQSVWESFRAEFPSMPAIIMAEAEIRIDDLPYIAKPAKLPDLLAAIKRTGTLQHGHVLNVASDNKAHSSAEALYKRAHGAEIKKYSGKDIYYQPEKFLQGKVTAAIASANQQKKSIFMRCWADRWIIVCPGIDFLYENIKQSQLQDFGHINIDHDIFAHEEILSDEQIKRIADTPIADIKCTQIYQFMWNITVRTASGRIPVGTSLDDLFLLEGWPNLTRLANIPNAMRISAFWIDNPKSISDVIESLGVAAEDVYTFFSASRAVGLMKLTQRCTDKVIKPEVDKSDNRMKSILAALMRKISKKAHINVDAA